MSGSLIQNDPVPEPSPVPECAEGWLACMPDNPCKRHVEYWKAEVEAKAKVQAPQPPAVPNRLDYGVPVQVTPGDPIPGPKPGPFTAQKLAKIFTYQPIRPDQLPRYTEIREAAMYFARVIAVNTPPCADQSAAIRHVREAVMTANAAIALDGLV